MLLGSYPDNTYTEIGGLNGEQASRRSKRMAPTPAWIPYRAGNVGCLENRMLHGADMASLSLERRLLTGTVRRWIYDV